MRFGSMESRHLGVMPLSLATFAVILLVGCASASKPAQRPDATPQFNLPESTTTSAAETSCTPTRPNGNAPPGEPASDQFFGNRKLFTVLWPEGEVVFTPGGSGEIRDDGSLVMKFPFWRGEGAEGRLTVTGRSLHRPGLDVSAEVPTGYGDSGFQATGLVFPEQGCWEITARSGTATLTFVTRVVLRE